jgi:hypothetical protein
MREGWTRIGGNFDGFFKWKERSPGDVIEGVWRGTVPGEYDELGKMDTEEGPVTFFLPAVLKRKLARVRVGSLTAIEYLGMVPMKNDKELHDFDEACKDANAIAPSLPRALKGLAKDDGEGPF